MKNTQPTPNQLARSIELQKVKITSLDARIGVLMSQRVIEEEALADLLAKQNPPTLIQNPVVDGGGQPFRGSQQVILEKRTPEGKLDFTGEQPPTNIRIFDDVWAIYYARTQPGIDRDGSWDALRAWLNSKGWVVRAKTW